MKLFTLLLVLIFSFNSNALTVEERKKLFDESIENLKGTGIEKKVPQIGQSFPDIVVDNKKISERIAGGSLLLIVYRGGWCPYCVKQLKEVQQHIEEFKSKNISILAISPETAMEVLKTKEKNNLSFEVTSDQSGEVLKQMGLIFRVDDEVAQEYKNLGINLAENQGNDRQELPVPATYLIDKNLKIHYGFVDADYRKRPAFNDLLLVIKDLK